MTQSHPPDPHPDRDGHSGDGRPPKPGADPAELPDGGGDDPDLGEDEAPPE